MQSHRISGVIQYFDQNWHNIKEQWVKCFIVKYHCFGQRTNNRLESLNQKLKTVITKYSALPAFISSLDRCIGGMCIEKDIKRAEAVMKKPADTSLFESHDYLYHKILTPFAFAKYKKQSNVYKTVRFVHIDAQMGVSGATQTSRVIASANSCECEFFSSMGIVCKHMLAFLKTNKMELFVPEVCLSRWKLENLELLGDSDYSLDKQNIETIQVT